MTGAALTCAVIWNLLGSLTWPKAVDSSHHQTHRGGVEEVLGEAMVGQGHDGWQEIEATSQHTLRHE